MDNVQVLPKQETLTWLNKKAKQTICALLEKLQHANLTLNDCEGKRQFGDNQARVRADLTVLDQDFYSQVLKGGSIAAGETYIDGLWMSSDLTKLIQVFAANQAQLDALEMKMAWLTKLKNTLFHSGNKNNQSGSKKNILAHYDLSNDLYEAFLDPSMLYSSAIYPSQEATLEQAQEYKLKVICEKLALNENDHLLEIGTGWGALAIYAAKHYGCKVTTTTISDNQWALANKRIKEAGLTDKITLLKEDYRNLTGEYSKLVSIEMIEAVGHEYLANFFTKCSSLIKDDGLMLLQAITIADQRYDHYRTNVDFIQRYIFPGGCLPSINVMASMLTKHTDMVIDNIQDIGIDYARTLNDWHHAFINNWHHIEKLGFDERFKRLWQFYLCYCEGAFLERVISTHHLVCRKPLHR
jgi:cyclopropane-fatty-acyl-phospholipid synthase